MCETDSNTFHIKIILSQKMSRIYRKKFVKLFLRQHSPNFGERPLKWLFPC